MDVLDFGCGTALLAIAAMRLGALSALGVDHDLESIQMAETNVRLNGFSDRLTILHGTWESVSGQYDLIFANLVASALLRGGHHLPRTMKKDSKAVLSGFSEKQRPEIEAFFCLQGLKPVKRMEKSGWCAMIMVRKENALPKK